MFVWARLPDGWDAGELLDRALRHEVAFVPGYPFFAGPPDQAALRLSFTTHDPAEIAEGLARLRALPHVTLHGLPGPEGRAATFCFSVQGHTARAVAERLAEDGIGVAAGHYYATMAMDALGKMPDGAVRASLLHYNTLEDVEALGAALARLG